MVFDLTARKLPAQAIPRMLQPFPNLALEAVALERPDSCHVHHVSSLHELIGRPLTGTVNALCWERTLPGDFANIVSCLAGSQEQSVLTLEPAMLRRLPLSHQGRIAMEVMLADHRFLSERNLDPMLNCVFSYPQDERSGPIATDVFSFHVDSAPCAFETWLCTYHGPGSEGLPNAHARRHIDVPATRAVLLAAYGGSDDAGFQDYLTENAYDLHYAALAGARPYSFGTGHLWRIATQHPGSAVQACIHRAPSPAPDHAPRLLLIS